MQIPKRFQLLARVYKVIPDDTLHERKMLGEIDHDECAISLRPQALIKPEYKDMQAFFHELAHAILISMGERELAANERFVDLLGAMMLQFDKTKE